ncbi:MAG: hypothetical protein ACREKH_22310 [Candidatus Rokuibacteriota bacterium]
MAKTVTIDKARAAKARALEIFQRLGAVASVGITRVDDGYGLKVNLREPLSPGVSPPAAVEGVPVRVEVVGVVRPR